MILTYLHKVIAQSNFHATCLFHIVRVVQIIWMYSNFANDLDNPKVILFSCILLIILLESNRSTGEMLSDALEGGMVQKYVYIVWSFWETILLSIYYCPCTLLNYVVYYTTHCSLDAQCSKTFPKFVTKFLLSDWNPVLNFATLKN